MPRFRGRRRLRLSAVLAALLFGCVAIEAAPAAAAAAAKPAPAAAIRELWLSQATRSDKAGWILLRLKGGPEARGFQQGYLLAKDIARALGVMRDQWQHDTAMDWGWAVQQSQRFILARISSESALELDGIAEGLAAANGIRTDRAELAAYNAYFDLLGYWWPKHKDEFAPSGSLPSAGPSPDRHFHCSAFVATGSATKDGRPVLAQNTHFDFTIAADFNVIAEVEPEQGHRFVMQSRPGWIHSGTDFFVTDAGIAGTETTIGDFNGFDENGVPEFDRARRAVQYAGSLDQWTRIMVAGNNGGYANAWLLADMRGGEIMRVELGLKRVAVTRSRDGFFTGSNIAVDPKLRVFETDSNDENIASSSVARRERWKQLMAEYRGKLDIETAKRLLGDDFDMLLGKTSPSHRTICARGDLDPGLVASGGFPPFMPEGAFDAKAIDAGLAQKLAFWASWGPPCGPDFDKAKFLAQHTQYDGLAPDLADLRRHDWIQVP